MKFIDKCHKIVDENFDTFTVLGMLFYGCFFYCHTYKHLASTIIAVIIVSFVYFVAIYAWYLNIKSKNNW